MKISYNWLRDYLDFNLVPQDVSEILTNTGLEVESVELFESVPGGLDGIVIGEIVECMPHPDADKLKVTKVNIGSGELLQIVCGAPNCRVGLKSPVALVGATLYPSSGDKLQIKKAKIRGVESFGMICADDELGLGASHAGIMELDPATRVGMPAAYYFKVEKDYTYEIGLTPNRSDAFSHIGVARDLSAALSAVYKIDLPLKLPVTSHQSPVSSQQFLGHHPTVSVEDPTACPRYSSVNISQVKVSESPDWLKNRLKAIGIRSINNVVDITNFVLHEYGQPLHAFDADKIRGGRVIVKKLPEGTVFKTLDGAERKLSSEDLMICDAVGGMCIAGVFGGMDSGVTDGTVNIFLESAHFDAVSIRRTATRHHLRTDAAMHFEKTCDINITVEALKRAASMICEICGGEISSEISDIYPDPVSGHPVSISLARINRLAGTDIPEEVVINILTKLGITIAPVSSEAWQPGKVPDDSLQLLVPTFKPDVKREADILEEILRIYGYNAIPMPKTLRSSLSFSPQVDYVKMGNIAANLLTGEGFHEISTNSVSRSEFEQDQDLKKQQILLLNSQTAELDSLRTSMLYSGLEVIAHNQNRKNGNLRLYEIGKTYHQGMRDEGRGTGEGGYIQKQHLALYLTGAEAEDNWLQKGARYDFYHLKSYVDNLLTRFGIHQHKSEVLESLPFVFAARWSMEDRVLATFGQIASPILKAFDIRQAVFYADIDWDYLIERSQFAKVEFQVLPKFPSVNRDLSLLVDVRLRFEQIEDLAYTETKKLLKNVELFDVYKGGPEVKSGLEMLGEQKKSYAVRFTFQDPEKTLNEQDIDKVMSRLMKKLDTELGAVVRK